MVKSNLVVTAQISGILSLLETSNWTKPSLNGVPIRRSAARYQLNDEQLSITANLDDAHIEISGNPGLTGHHDMDLRITEIDIGKLSRNFANARPCWRRHAYWQK